MADVQAAFGILLALGIAFPGLLVAVRLLLPRAVATSSARIEAHPARSFGRGLLRAGLAGLAIFAFLAAAAGPIQLVGALLGFATLAWAAVGAAGLADMMSGRMLTPGSAGPAAGGTAFNPTASHGPTSSLGPWQAFALSAVALELAAVFPAVGWFVILPFLLILCLGAAPRPMRLSWTFARTAGASAMSPTTPSVTGRSEAGGFEAPRSEAVRFDSAPAPAAPLNSTQLDPAPIVDAPPSDLRRRRELSS